MADRHAGAGGDKKQVEWIEHIREQAMSMRRGEDSQYAQRVGDFLGGLQTGSRNNQTPEMPFRVDTDLFTPQGIPLLANGRSDSVVVLAFSPTPFDAKSSFELSAYLTDAAGARVPLGAPLALAKMVGEPDGFRRFVLKVTPTGVPAGEYTFHVRLKDPLADEPAETIQAVHVDENPRRDP